MDDVADRYSSVTCAVRDPKQPIAQRARRVRVLQHGVVLAVAVGAVDDGVHHVVEPSVPGEAFPRRTSLQLVELAHRWHLRGRHLLDRFARHAVLQLEPGAVGAEPARAQERRGVAQTAKTLDEDVAVAASRFVVQYVAGEDLEHSVRAVGRANDEGARAFAVREALDDVHPERTGGFVVVNHAAQCVGPPSPVNGS